MPETPRITLTYRFAYNHIESEGKYVNLTETLEAMNAGHVCLSLTNGAVEPAILEADTIHNRFARLQVVIRKLRRQGITTDLVVPSLTDQNPSNRTIQSYRDDIYDRAALLKIRTLWVDDSVAACHRNYKRNQLIALFRRIRKRILGKHPDFPIGLIAAAPSRYSPFQLTAYELAKQLASTQGPILAQAQRLDDDYNRTDILEIIDTLAASRAHAESYPSIRSLGSIDQRLASEYHKSAEATQMQINLNVLFGFGDILFNGFDSLGSPAGPENPYLKIIDNSDGFLGKLSKLLPARPCHQGLTMLLAETASSDGLGTMFRRFGLPVTVRTPESVLEADGPFILTGSLPSCCSVKQLKHIFHHGVLLDASAACTLQEMGHTELLGCTVGKPLRSIQLEVLSDQTFAAPYYGRRTQLSPPWPGDACVALKPTHKDARFITTLQRPGKILNIPGMVIFDDHTRSHRCAVLPYDLSSGQDDSSAFPDPLLSTFRRRHFQDLLQWLYRKRLCCMVENTPDLIPFYIPVPQKRRILLALLNVSFDWAIDARIRFGSLGRTVKQVRELNEQGQLVAYPDLQFSVHRDYPYIQLTSDTAVAPMQMTVLVLDT